MTDLMPTSLVGPISLNGFCLRRERLDVDRLIWLDFNAPVFSGDAVTLFLWTSKGLEIAGKVLQLTRDGRLWAICWSYPDREDLAVVPLDHPKVSVLAIAKTALEVTLPRSKPRPESPVLMTEQIQAQFDRLGAPALREWRAHGFPPRTRIRVSNSQSVIHQLIRRIAA